MTAPTPLDLHATPRERQLLAELSEERRMGAEARRQMRLALRGRHDAEQRAAALDERLLGLQQSNESAYKAAYEATGGPGFDKRQPFGHKPAASDGRQRLADMCHTTATGTTPIRTLHHPGDRAAWAVIDRQNQEGIA